MKKVIIYTDGACRNNPGPGGWGATLEYQGLIKEISGFSSLTTNNKMELTAVIKALELLKETCIVDIYSDSRYVIDGITKWMFNWKKKSFKNVKNVELWLLLDNLVVKHNITWHWVKGHSGCIGNERADFLATSEIAKNCE